ncbi:MAG: NAD(P)-dependent oxidoreductase [Gammaproteobacteria bacterium]|nr:NAD(P)-dependent oxidoreductase [Gammaproteobacteria bacterium]
MHCCRRNGALACHADCSLLQARFASVRSGAEQGLKIPPEFFCKGSGFALQYAVLKSIQPFPDMKVAFIGLGVMGYPMAGHLAANGHEVCVYNRTTTRSEKWLGLHRGTMEKTPAMAASEADVVFSCVGNDDDVRSVTTGPDGAFGAMRRGTVFVDHTTASANVARELSAAAKQRGFDFLDAPVSGGQAGAENGVLTVMVGGEEAVFERAKPLIDCYARAAMLMGPAGAGQLTKMVNQICIAGLVQGLSEGLAFAVNADLDGMKVFDVISKGAAGSWQMENRHETMLKDEFEFGFAVDWMRKDLGLCMDEAKRNGSELPVTEIVDGYYAEVQAADGNRFDTSSLVTRLYRKDLTG